MRNLKYFIQLGIPPCLLLHPDHPVSHRDHQGDPGSVSLKLSIALLARLKKILHSNWCSKKVLILLFFLQNSFLLYWNWCADRSSPFYTNGSSCSWKADEKSNRHQVSVWSMSVRVPPLSLRLSFSLSLYLYLRSCLFSFVFELLDKDQVFGLLVPSPHLAF